MNSDRRNSAWLSAQHVLFLLLSLVNLRLNLATFGKEHFDVWLIFASLWGVGSSLDFGFGVAVVSLIARGLHESDRRFLEGVIGTGLVMFTAAGLLLVGSGHAIAGALFFPDHRLVPPSFPDARSVFSLLGVSFFFQYLSIFFRSVVEGTEDFVGSSRVAMGNSVVVTAGVVIAWVFHLSMVWLAAIYAAAAALQSVAFGFLVRKRLPGVRLAAGIRPEVLRRLLGSGVAIQATSVLGALIDPVVKYVLGIAGTSGTVSVYEIARRFSLAVSGLFAAAFRNHLPKTSVLRLRGEVNAYLTTEGSRVISSGVRYSSVAFGGLSLILVMLMVYMYGSPESLLFFCILALGETMNICGYMSYLFLLGTGRAALLVLVQAVNIVCTGAGVVLGYRLVGTPIGLLFYPIGVFIGNVFMFAAIRRNSDVRFGDLMSRDRLLRLSVLLLCLGANVCVVAAGLQPVILWQVGFAVTTGVIFRSDAVMAYDLIRGMLFRPRGLAGKA